MEWVAQTGMYRWSTSTFENFCGCTALDMPECREITERIDRLAAQQSQVACVWEDLKCCWYKAKDIIPSIASRKEA